MQDNTQLTHADHKPTNKKFPLSIIANDINSPLNIGSLFRLCDALGMEKLYLCGGSAIPPNTKISKTSRSTEKTVDYEYHADAEELLSALSASDALIIALEITAASIAINTDKFSSSVKAAFNNNKKIYLILGSENTGVSAALLAQSELTTHIPMFGKNSSMNVVSAASIACFEISKNLLASF